MEIILNILQEELMNPIDENISDIINQVNNDDDDIEDDLDECVLGLLEMADENGLEICPHSVSSVKIQNHFDGKIVQYNDNQFFENFCMKKEVFMKLENEIRPHIEKSYVPLRKKILLTIWLLVNQETFRSVANRFDLGKSAAHFVFKEVITALVIILPQYIKWPNPENCNIIEAAFRSRQKRFSGVIGAIDACHIAIRQPSVNANDYYNKEGFHSVILQGTCDHTGKFIDIMIGRPGKANNALVFRSSPLFKSLHHPKNPLLLPEQHIIANSTYPLSLSVLTPFRDNGHLTEQQTFYNTKHASLRSIIKRAFGLLKVKFRRLFYLDVKSVTMANKIVAAVCTLHNFILVHGAGQIRDDINLQNDVSEFDNNNDENFDNEVDENEDIFACKKRIQIMNSLL